MDHLARLGNGAWEIKCNAAENCLSRRHGRKHYYINEVSTTANEVGIKYSLKSPRSGISLISLGQVEMTWLTVPRDEFCEAILATAHGTELSKAFQEAGNSENQR